MTKPLQHYSVDTNFFSYEPSTTNEFVIGACRPAYSLVLDIMGLDNIHLDSYINGSSFNKNYQNAIRAVETYVYDIMHNTPLLVASKAALEVIMAKQGYMYVIKGEFILRVINDFILGKIKLNNVTHKEFTDFNDDNKPYWKDTLVELKYTVIEIPRGQPLKEYTYLIDRYETYDKDFINNMVSIVDIFVF